MAMNNLNPLAKSHRAPRPSLEELSRRGIPSMYLQRSGWFRSVHEGLPIDASGNPLPWYTYPAIAFLSPRVNETWNVFEFGAGYSTAWWARRVARLIAVEHDASWAKTTQQLLTTTSKGSILLREGEDYAAEIGKHGIKFHVVVIDGQDRHRCAMTALDHMTEDGVMIWDNAEIRRHINMMEALQARAGFRRVDFEGIGPIRDGAWWTSILYRDRNCLGL
jgi:hypothetical protein